MQVPAEAAAWAEGAAHAKTATREMQNPPEKVERASLAEELKEGVWGKEGREWSCRATRGTKSLMRGRCGDFRRVSNVLRFVP